MQKSEWNMYIYVYIYSIWRRQILPLILRFLVCTNSNHCIGPTHGTHPLSNTPQLLEVFRIWDWLLSLCLFREIWGRILPKKILKPTWPFPATWAMSMQFQIRKGQNLGKFIIFLKKTAIDDRAFGGPLSPGPPYVRGPGQIAPFAPLFWVS